jgi:hypothetical protein
LFFLKSLKNKLFCFFLNFFLKKIFFFVTKVIFAKKKSGIFILKNILLNISFFLMFTVCSGQNPENSKTTKTPLQKGKAIPTKEKLKQDIKKEIPKAKPKTEIKKTVSKPDAVKTKPIKENNIESLLIEDKIDTTKTILDSFSVEKKEIEDTIIVEKILPEEISKLQKGKAYIIGKKVLTACITSKIKEFSEEDFSERILNKFSLEYLSNICINVNRRFGNFEDLLFNEALRVEKHKTTIYRFKAVYTKKFFMKELRIYMNDQNKITSLKTLTWKPEYKPRKKPKRRQQVIDSLLIREKDTLYKDSAKILENKNIIQEKVDKSFLLE